MDANKSPNAFPVFQLSALLLLVVYGTLAWFSRGETDLSIGMFAVICAVAFILSLVAARSVYLSSGRVSFRHVVFWCCLIRIIAVCGEPIYEDDYYRYLWDGRQTVETGSPYSQSPSAAFDVEEDPVWSEVLDNINYPDLRTVYGPVNQYVFALAYLVSPGDVFVLQVMMAAVDILIICLLAQMAPLWAVALYGFSPLIIKEFAMTAHPDVLSVAALLWATLAWQRDRLYLAAVALAIAVAAKIFALLLVPLLLRWSWRCWVVFLAILVALYIPILDRNGSVEALSAMAQSGLFNAPVYFLLEAYVDVQIIRLVLLASFVGFYAWYFFHCNPKTTGPRTIPRADAIFFFMLLALPIFNTWYFVFVLAYAAIHPSLWAWTGSVTILFAYATGLQLDGTELQLYEQPAWASIAGFMPIFLAFLVQILRPHWGSTQG